MADTEHPRGVRVQQRIHSPVAWARRVGAATVNGRGGPKRSPDPAAQRAGSSASGTRRARPPDDPGSGGGMLTNPTEIGTARLPLRRSTRPRRRTDASPSARRHTERAGQARHPHRTPPPRSARSSRGPPPVIAFAAARKAPFAGSRSVFASQTSQGQMSLLPLRRVSGGDSLSAAPDRAHRGGDRNAKKVDGMKTREQRRMQYGGDAGGVSRRGPVRAGHPLGRAVDAPRPRRRVEHLMETAGAGAQRAGSSASGTRRARPSTIPAWEGGC